MFFTANSKRLCDVCKQLMSLLVSSVSCLSPWARQYFPAPLKTEETMSHRYKNHYSDVKLPESDMHFFCTMPAGKAPWSSG